MLSSQDKRTPQYGFLSLFNRSSYLLIFYNLQENSVLITLRVSLEPRLWFYSVIQFPFKEKREFELLEKEIADLEKEKEGIYEKLNLANQPFDELQQLSKRIAVITGLLEEKEMRWLELGEGS